jgi:hypothetical protein
MSPSKIMIIRHGEKPADPPVPAGAPIGVSELGQPDEHDLIVRGWQRAGALARLFAPVGGRPAGAKLSTPTVLFAPGPGAIDKSARALHTLGPLSALTGLAIDSALGVGDEEKLAAAVLEKEGVVLVAWEHKKIQDIVAYLTGRTIASPHWPGKRFDMVLVLTPSPWRLEQVPQMVLAGDLSTPFGAADGA